MASRSSSPRPPAPPGTPWCSTTRCDRCSPTCARTVVPTGVFAASSDFGSGSAVSGGSLSARIDRAAGELADKILRRGTTLTDDPFADPTPFEDLLNGQA